jgi:hypothetical protein
LRPGDEVLRISRWRDPAHEIEENIHGDEVPLAPWYLCEEDGGLLMAIEEAGMCCDISSPIKDQIREYREAQLSFP